MVASGGGAPIPDDDALATAIFAARDQMRLSPGIDGHKQYVAQIGWENARSGEVVSSTRSAADNGAWGVAHASGVGVR